MKDPLVAFHVVLTEPRPPSVNKMYSSRGNRRFLTKEGRAFKDALASKVAQASVFAVEPHISWPQAIDLVYKEGCYVRVVIDLYLPRLFNRSWEVGGSMTEPKPNKKTGVVPEPTPRSPYQQVDGPNYVKIILDGLVQGTGIDDSAYLSVCLNTYEDEKRPRVEVTFEVREHEQNNGVGEPEEGPVR